MTFLKPLCFALISVAAGCTSDDDCSLNGVCGPIATPSGVTVDACHCDAEWTGPACSTLNLEDPAAVVPAYPSVTMVTPFPAWLACVFLWIDPLQWCPPIAYVTVSNGVHPWPFPPACLYTPPPPPSFLFWVLVLEVVTVSYLAATRALSCGAVAR